MLPRLLAKTADLPREKLLWMVLGALVVAQLVAFWMLCSSQVRNAELRDATWQAQRVAAVDCLRFLPRATLNSCAGAAAQGNGRSDGQGATRAGQQSALSSAVPVSFTFR